MYIRDFYLVNILQIMTCIAKMDISDTQWHYIDGLVQERCNSRGPSQ